MWTPTARGRAASVLSRPLPPPFPFAPLAGVRGPAGEERGSPPPRLHPGPREAAAAAGRAPGRAARGETAALRLPAAALPPPLWPAAGRAVVSDVN